MPGQFERKLGCAATRQVGSAVVRNRFRRKLKEFYRLNKHLWPEQTHYLVLIRRPISDWSDIEGRLSRILASIPHPPPSTQ
ncbi:MAG: ribonuclease P protein component [bacterium]|nr:ribonuclease P protein component [bacterium]